MPSLQESKTSCLLKTAHQSLTLSWHRTPMCCTATVWLTDKWCGKTLHLFTSEPDIHVYFKYRAAWLTKLLMPSDNRFLSGCTVCSHQRRKWIRDFQVYWNVTTIPEDSDLVRFDGSAGITATGNVSVHILVISA